MRRNLAKVETILAQSQINGVEGTEMIGGNAARAMEAELSCIGALWSPETGIIDSHGYMRALWGELEDHGGMIAFATPVERMSYKAPHWQVHFGGREPGVIDFDAVVNAAGLGAQALARRIEGYPAEQGAAAGARQGQLFRLRRQAGIFAADLSDADRRRAWRSRHARSRRAHAVRAGRRMDREENYTVDPRRADSFYARIRTYWPGLPENSLVPDYCGIRPKLTGPGEGQADFMIAGPADHGMPRLVNLFGIESPGLTSSLSIAEDVVKYLS